MLLIVPEEIQIPIRKTAPEAFPPALLFLQYLARIYWDSTLLLIFRFLFYFVGFITQLAAVDPISSRQSFQPHTTLSLPWRSHSNDIQPRTWDRVSTARYFLVVSPSSHHCPISQSGSTKRMYMPSFYSFSLSYSFANINPHSLVHTSCFSAHGSLLSSALQLPSVLMYTNHDNDYGTTNEYDYDDIQLLTVAQLNCQVVLIFKICIPRCKGNSKRYI